MFLRLLLCLLLPLSLCGQSDYIQNTTDSLATLADQAFYKSDGPLAMKYVKELLQFLEEEGQKEEWVYAQWKRNYALLLNGMGQHEKAIETFLEIEAITIETQGKISIAYSLFHNNISAAYGHLNQLTKETYHLKEAYKIVREIGDKTNPHYSLVMLNLGRNYRDHGEYEKALEIMTEMLEVTALAHGADSAKYAQRLASLSRLYIHLQQYEKALPPVIKAKEMLDSLIGPESLNHKITYRCLREIYFAIGEYDRALKSAYTFLEITGKIHGKNYYHYGKALRNVGEIYAELGKRDSTEYYYRAAMKNLSDNYGKDYLEYQKTKFKLAEYYSRIDKPEDARQITEEVLSWEIKNSELLPENIGLTRYGLLAELYNRKGEYDRAEANVRKALELCKNQYGQGNFTTSEYRFLLASILEGSGRIDEAKEELSATTENYLSYIYNVFPYLSEAQQQTFIKRFLKSRDFVLSFAMRHPDEQIITAAYNTGLQLKGLLLNLKKEFKDFDYQEKPELQRLYDEWEDTGKKLALYYSAASQSIQITIDSLENLHSKQATLLSKASAEFRERKRLTAADIQKRLDDKQILLEVFNFSYVRMDKTETDSSMYVAYILGSDKAKKLSQIVLFEEEKLGNLNATRRLYRLINTDNTDNLYQLLFSKIKPYLQNTEEVYYSTAGALHRVNLSAVPVNQRQTFGEAYKLFNLSGAFSLFSKKTSKENTSPTAVVYGGINYSKNESDDPTSPLSLSVSPSFSIGNSFRSLRGNDWEYLEFTKKEAEKVAEILNTKNYSVKLRQGFQAKEETFKALGETKDSPDIIHIATHGYFFPSVDTTGGSGFQKSPHPLIRSGLILANANKTWRSNQIKKGEDGILTAYEISQLNLKNTELVVLSACDTGLGDIDRNEGVYGLQRAFKTAGVRYILMSLWSVNDEKTYTFMTRFYELYINEGKTIPEAYQITQSEMRRKYALPFNPRNWAGFVLLTNE